MTCAYAGCEEAGDVEIETQSGRAKRFCPTHAGDAERLAIHEG